MIALYANWTGNLLYTGQTLEDAHSKLTALDCASDTKIGTSPDELTALDIGDRQIIPGDKLAVLHLARKCFPVVMP